MKALFLFFSLAAVASFAQVPLWEKPFTTFGVAEGVIMDLATAKDGVNKYIVYKNSKSTIELLSIKTGQAEATFTLPEIDLNTRRTVTYLKGYTGSGWAMLVATSPAESSFDPEDHHWSIAEPDGDVIIQGIGVKPQIYWDGTTSYVLISEYNKMKVYKLAEGINLGAIPKQSTKKIAQGTSDESKHFANGRAAQESKPFVRTFSR